MYDSTDANLEIPKKSYLICSIAKGLSVCSICSITKGLSIL